MLGWGVVREGPPMDIGTADPRTQLHHSWVMLSAVMIIGALLLQAPSITLLELDAS